jgi:hypothetical protein
LTCTVWSSPTLKTVVSLKPASTKICRTVAGCTSWLKRISQIVPPVKSMLSGNSGRPVAPAQIMYRKNGRITITEIENQSRRFSTI